MRVLVVTPQVTGPGGERRPRRRQSVRGGLDLSHGPLAVERALGSAPGGEPALEELVIGGRVRATGPRLNRLCYRGGPNASPVRDRERVGVDRATHRHTAVVRLPERPPERGRVRRGDRETHPVARRL